MQIKKRLNELGLNSRNTVVIGSGILSALNLRKSKDIDVIVTQEKYQALSTNKRFKEKESHGQKVLVDDLFEIRKGWTVLGKTWQFDDLFDQSTVINGVRYNRLEFLLKVKRRWIADGEGRPKDTNDVKLMENYLKNQKSSLS